MSRDLARARAGANASACVDLHVHVHLDSRSIYNVHRSIHVHVLVALERFHESGYTPSAMIRKHCTNVLLLLILTQKGVVDQDTVADVAAGR